MIKTALAYVLACVPMVASANAWDEFEARCLLPYENLQPAVLDALPNTVEAFTVDDEDFAGVVYQNTAPPWFLLSVGKDAVGQKICVMATESDDGTKAFDWRDTQLEAGRYVLTPKDKIDWLASNEWIEPKVFVAIIQYGNMKSYTVMETNLES